VDPSPTDADAARRTVLLATLAVVVAGAVLVEMALAPLARRPPVGGP
jgi:hypothetical protein